jgi:hypothetical protein
MSAGDFALVHERLRSHAGRGGPRHYLVPEFLCGGETPALVDVGDPYRFFAAVFDRILTSPAGPRPGRGLSHDDRVYLSYLRSFASLNGAIGTALTQIAFLPFIRDTLGATVFVCLPTGRIGSTNRKGSRGSPFAISNPFELDPAVADPLLPGVAALTQYRALVQACRLLGMRAGSIVPLAALSIDSPLFAALPGLGYWWAAEPGSLVTCAPVDAAAGPAVRSGPTTVDPAAAARFTAAPASRDVRLVSRGGDHYFWAPAAPGAGSGTTLANAFPDVLAGDAATYTWGDVALIRYGADICPGPAGVRRPVAGDETLPAWTLLPAVLAWRHRELGESVMIIDVSRSIPAGVLHRARRIAAHWRDDFAARLGQLGAGSLPADAVAGLLAELRRAAAAPESADPDLTLVGEELWEFDAPDASLDAVCGPLTYCVSAHAHNRPVFVASLVHHLAALEHRTNRNAYLAGASNHDTMPPPPWATGLLYALYAFLPGAVPLLYSGVEWAAQQITNKEFGFHTSPELRALRDRLDDRSLGLFNDRPVDWSELAAAQPSPPAYRVISDILAAQARLSHLSGWSYALYQPDPYRLPGCVGYLRGSPGTAHRLVVLANLVDRPAAVRWTFGAAYPVVTVPREAAPAAIAAASVVVLPPRSVLVAMTTEEPAVRSLGRPGGPGQPPVPARARGRNPTRS